MAVSFLEKKNVAASCYFTLCSGPLRCKNKGQSLWLIGAKQCFKGLTSPFVFVHAVIDVGNPFEIHLVYQVETPRSPLVALVLVVCSEHQLCHKQDISSATRANIPRLVAKLLEKFFAYDTGDTGQLMRG